MPTHLSTTSHRLVTGLLILAVLFSILAEPITAWANSISTPAKCSGGNFTLFSGEGTVTIENVIASNITSLGCDIRGSMRVQIRGNDKGNIPILGTVDAYNHFTSTSIGQFDLQIAGLTLVVKSSSYSDVTLHLTQPWIKIPDSWGGLEAPIPQSMKLDAGGLEVVSFSLPSLQSEKGFKLDLEGSLGLVSGGYQINAKGTLGLPDIGKTKDCAITVDVTLIADVFGQAVMYVSTPDSAETVTLGSGRTEIANPTGEQALVPASMPLQSYYLPVPDTVSYEVLLQIQNRAPPPEADLQALTQQPVQTEDLATSNLGPAYGPPAQSDPSAPAGDVYLVPTASNLTPVSALAEPAQTDMSAYYESLPWLEEETTMSPQDVGVVVIASAECGVGIPIDGTGFELTGVEGTLSLRPESEFVSLKIVFKSSVKVADIAALTAEAEATFQWEPEFAFSLEGSLTVLDMFNVGEASISVSESDGFRTTVNWNSWFIKTSISVHAWTTTSTYCSEWESWCYYPYPLPPICGTACSETGTIDDFHFTGSASCKLGLAKGELVSECFLPYPCGCRWCRKWFIYYPCCKTCWACFDIPPFDIWLAGAGAEFGEFTGDRWGLKGYVSFFGFTTGFYVDHTGDLDFGDVSGYRLVDSTQLDQARQAWLVAQQGDGLANAGPLDETFTFLADDRVLVNFDLPLTDAYRTSLAPTDLISNVQVITQTDTIFSVKTDIPMTVTMLSPEGVEITPENYGTHPGDYSIEYTQVMTYEQMLTPSEEADQDQARWRFIPASNNPDFAIVDVLLDGTAVFTDVQVVDEDAEMYRDYFPYTPVEPGEHTLEVRPVDTAPLASSLSIISGTDTTVMLVGEAEAELLVINDDNSPPSDFGYGRLRVVNAATNANPMDVDVGDFSIPDLEYKSTSDYLEVPAGTYSLSLASSGFDPLLAISLTGEVASVAYGIKVASAGDVNGDGYDDVLVADNAFDNERGKVYLYHGSPAGMVAEPAWTMAGEHSTIPDNAGDRFGTALAGAGDVNADGFDDVVIGAPMYGPYPYRGKAYLYLGSESGLSDTPAWSIEPTEGREYGASVAGAGDVNGDGFDDVLVGMPEKIEVTAGDAFLYYGGPGPVGLSTTPDWTVDGYFESLYASNFGTALAGAGDVNGDGFDDVIVGAPAGSWEFDTNVGKALLFLGSAGGPSTYPDWVAEGEDYWDRFGLALDGVGDLNGDGYDDVLVAAPKRSDPHELGKIYVYHGSSSGLASTAVWTAQGDDLQTHLGSSVAGAGDVNGDGLDDFYVGAYTAYDYDNMGLGKAYLFDGSFAGSYGSLNEAWMISGNSSDDYFGISVDGAGDVNGDGYADLVAGALGNQGRAEVFLGGIGMLPMPAIVDEGDVLSFYSANLGQEDSLLLMSTSDEIYQAITETRFVVDQAITGTWSVNLEGDTSTATYLTVAAITAHDPPIVEDLQVDASNLAETLVSWRLLSDYLPVTISIFANDGPITQTMVITDPLPVEETIPLFQGIEVATIPIDESLAVKAAVVSTTVDLSFLESGNYKLWVRVEDGVSPPVQGYVWGVPTFATAAASKASNRVRVAAQSYDSLAQASGAAEIVIDHSASFGENWTSTITPSINPRFTRMNSQGELEEVVIDGLFVEFTPYDHPDVDSYLLEISGIGATHVITAGNTTYYHYDEAGEPVGDPVNYAIFNGLNPKTTYTIRLGAQDIDSDQIAWSQEHVVTVPLGDFSLAATQDVIEVSTGQEQVETTLLLTMTADLFSYVSIYLDGEFLPPGISIREISYQLLTNASLAAAYAEFGGLPNPAYLTSEFNSIQTPEAASQDTTVLVHLVLSLPDDLPLASYMLPLVAYSGELVKGVNVHLQVGAPQTILVNPDSTQTTFLNANLPLPTCATSIRVGVLPGTFSVPALLSFEQSTSNVTNLQGIRFAKVHFILEAANASNGAAIKPSQPVSVEMEYDPACLARLNSKGLHLRNWSESSPDLNVASWSGDGISCQPDLVHNRLNCGVDQLGEFALFGPMQLYLPVIRN